MNNKINTKKVNKTKSELFKEDIYKKFKFAFKKSKNNLKLNSGYNNLDISFNVINSKEMIDCLLNNVFLDKRSNDKEQFFEFIDMMKFMKNVISETYKKTIELSKEYGLFVSTDIKEYERYFNDLIENEVLTEGAVSKIRIDLTLRFGNVLMSDLMNCLNYERCGYEIYRKNVFDKFKNSMNEYRISDFYSGEICLMIIDKLEKSVVFDCFS